MECRMRTRVKEMVENLAREYQRELAAAGTFVALEKLTAEIGDEFGRQLCENELLNRARWAAIVEQCDARSAGCCAREWRRNQCCFRGFAARSPSASAILIHKPRRENGEKPAACAWSHAPI